MFNVIQPTNELKRKRDILSSKEYCIQIFNYFCKDHINEDYILTTASGVRTVVDLLHLIASGQLHDRLPDEIADLPTHLVAEVDLELAI